MVSHPFPGFRVLSLLDLSVRTATPAILMARLGRKFNHDQQWTDQEPFCRNRCRSDHHVCSYDNNMSYSGPPLGVIYRCVSTFSLANRECQCPTDTEHTALNPWKTKPQSAELGNLPAQHFGEPV